MTKACIFDLDGVLVDTIDLHLYSWQTLAKHLGFNLPDSIKDSFRGASRMKSLQIVLDTLGIKATETQKIEYCEIKNVAYLKSLQNISSNILLPGALQLIKSLSDSEIKIGLASASKNAKNIIVALALDIYFDVMVDANDVTQTKPHPEVFNLTAQKLKCSPSECLVFEDSPLGIEAAIAGNFMNVGVGNPNSLTKADMNITNLENITIQTIRDFNKKQI